MKLADEIKFRTINAGGPGSGRKPENGVGAHAGDLHDTLAKHNFVHKFDSPRDLNEADDPISVYEHPASLERVHTYDGGNWTHIPKSGPRQDDDWGKGSTALDKRLTEDSPTFGKNKH